jgi:hypothetical protein
MIAIVMIAGMRPERSDGASRSRRNSAALALLLAGVAASAGLYLGFKNRPGAYQGSPSHYMDPTQSSGFKPSAIAATGPIELPSNSEDLQVALSAYANCLQRVLDGYYILDRNYNYHFHNELFLRNTPLLPGYRAAGLKVIEAARHQRAAGDEAADRVRMSADNPLTLLLADVRAYVDFTFERAAALERMSAQFETTKAGLQHATHIYEGEGKYLGVQLAELLARHQAALKDPAAAPLVSDFVAKSQAIYDKYSNRIVGF